MRPTFHVSGTAANSFALEHNWANCKHTRLSTSLQNFVGNRILSLRFSVRKFSNDFRHLIQHFDRTHVSSRHAMFRRPLNPAALGILGLSENRASKLFRMMSQPPALLFLMGVRWLSERKALDNVKQSRLVRSCRCPLSLHRQV